MMPAALERMVSRAAREALEGMVNDLERNLRSLVLEHLLREMDGFVRSKRSPATVTTVAPRTNKRRHLLDDVVDKPRALPPKNGAAKRGSTELKEKLAQAMRESWARRRKAAAPPEPPAPEEPEAKGFVAWKRQRDEAQVASDQRLVVVRVDGKPPRIALLVGEPAPGFFQVRLYRSGSLSNWQTGRCFSPKVKRVVEGELVRDVTRREITLGYIVPDGSPTESASGGGS